MARLSWAGTLMKRSLNVTENCQFRWEKNVVWDSAEQWRADDERGGMHAPGTAAAATQLRRRER